MIDWFAFWFCAVVAAALCWCGFEAGIKVGSFELKVWANPLMKQFVNKEPK